MCIHYNYIKDCRQRGERGPVVDGAKQTQVAHPETEERKGLISLKRHTLVNR